MVPADALHHQPCSFKLINSRTTVMLQLYSTAPGRIPPNCKIQQNSAKFSKMPMIVASLLSKVVFINKSPRFPIFPAGACFLCNAEKDC
jgi:hypothetical protein